MFIGTLHEAFYYAYSAFAISTEEQFVHTATSPSLSVLLQLRNILNQDFLSK
jgi:hypothetical protein